jgi:hypothetical protein
VDVIYRLLWVLVLGVHFAYLLFLPIGGFLAWRWPKVMWFHLAAIAWAVGSLTVHYDCPLTTIEDNLERHAGGHPTGQFMDRYVNGYIVPHGYDWVPQLLFVVAIVVSYVGIFQRARAKRRRVAVG